jgi:hypothetical protein
MGQRARSAQRRSNARKIERGSLDVADEQASDKGDIRHWLLGIGWIIVLIPLIFFLRFGHVGPMGWGLTVFLVVLSLLISVGIFFRGRPAYHTPVGVRGGWLDRIGALWLVACAFGPAFGWALTAFPLTHSTWRWMYGGQVLLAVVLPSVTALPLLRYVRGRGAPIMLALLIGVTALPVWSGWAALRDLTAAPVRQTAHPTSPGTQVDSAWHLPHTGRVLEGP